jgi:hypothetical protein
MFENIRRWSRRRKYREGKTLSQFIARDVRRDILIISAARIDEGIVICRVRTMNVLYVSRGLVPQPAFEPERELHIDEMWHWTGKSWGGLPDGTSILDHGGHSRSQRTWIGSGHTYEGFPLYLRHPTNVDTPANRERYPKLAVVSHEYGGEPDGWGSFQQP